MIEVALLVLVFAIFAIFGLHGMTDSKYSMLVSENLLRDQSFVIDESSMPRAKAAPFSIGAGDSRDYPYQIENNNGILLYGYPVGSSILSIPFVALMNTAGVSAHTREGGYSESGERQIQGTLAGLLMAILAVVFFRTALLFLPLSWSIIMALGGAFSTQIWSTASRVLWSHTWQIFLLGLTSYLLLSQEKRQSRGRPVVIATLLSWAYFVRPTSSIPIAAISAYILIFRRKEFPALAITGAAWVVVFVFYSWRLSGQPLPSYYLFSLNSQHLWEAVAGDLVSPSRGLFVYVPSAAFALLLTAYYWRVLPHRRLAVLSLIIITVHTLVIATDPNWWGGHCYGARLMTDLIPWFFLLAVLGSRCLLDDPRPVFRRYVVVLGLFTLVIGAAMNGRGALSQAANDWVNGPPDVDQKSERVWEWSNPQFLGGLQMTRRHRSD